MPDPIRLYDDNADDLLNAESFPDRVSLLPSEHSQLTPGSRIRVMWGQDMLRDVLDGRYRSVICSVNDEDNARGIIAQLCSLVTTSQWSVHAVTSYAKMFQEAVHVHAAQDREPYILKYDLDSVLILAILRPKGRDHFTLAELGRGFQTISKMIAGRAERRPICSVSFLSARSNRLVAGAGPNPDEEPSFETVLRTMYQSGYRGDVYAAPPMWRLGHVGVFPSYPFPAGVERMRAGSS
jgi:hypothetical protein